MAIQAPLRRFRSRKTCWCCHCYSCPTSCRSPKVLQGPARCSQMCSGSQGRNRNSSNDFTKRPHAQFKECSSNKPSRASFCASSAHIKCQRSRPAFRFLHLLLFLFLAPLDHQPAPQGESKQIDLHISKQRTRSMGFGVSFAYAALCSVNICVNGTCYENGGLQMCVCDNPHTGPLCDEVTSMCTDGCGIRQTTGVDCSSALCSLGICTDLTTKPYFKCDCGDFFTGPNCSTHNNPCTNPAANPCGHGTCTFAPGKGSGTVTCTCNADYETAFGAGVTIVKWGNSEVIQSPPCTVRKSRGIAKLHLNLSSGELVIWWAIFACAILMLIWCCYTVFSECCGRWSTAFKAARTAKNISGA